MRTYIFQAHDDNEDMYVVRAKDAKQAEQKFRDHLFNLDMGPADEMMENFILIEAQEVQ